MDKAITLKLLFSSIMLITLYPETTESYWMPRGQRPRSPSPRPIRPLPIPTDPATAPVCENQFTLANRACALIPYTPVPPPTQEGSRHHRHRHHHGHDHHHHHHQGQGNATQPEEECCRWLKEVDSVCVCNVLVHLPIFLSRPAHKFTAVVNDVCAVTYECASRVVRV